MTRCEKGMHDLDMETWRQATLPPCHECGQARYGPVERQCRDCKKWVERREPRSVMAFLEDPR